MRRAFLSLALAAAVVCVVTPASAATVVTTASGCTGPACPALPAKLNTFDSSLGTLEDVIVDVEVDALRAYLINFQTFASPDPSATTGSAHLGYSGPFNFSLNGVTYSLTIAGDQNRLFTIADLGFPSGEFHATGSVTFNVDHALLNSFVSGAADCGTFVCAIGLTPPASIQNSVISSNNVTFSDFDAAALTQYRLTYVYRTAVPEPGTWMMMLMGFAGMAFATRRHEQRKSTISC